MHAVLNNWKGSSRKFNVLLKAVRGRRAMEVVDQLRFLINPSAEALRKLILSAVSNATQKAPVDVNSLQVAEATVGRARYLKRVHFKGRGKTGRVTRPFCNVRVSLKEVLNG